MNQNPIVQKIAEVCGVDMALAFTLGLTVYTITQGAKKYTGKTGWKVVSLVLVLSAVVSVLFTCGKPGGIVLTWHQAPPAFFLACFVAFFALTAGTINSRIADNRNLEASTDEEEGNAASQPVTMSLDGVKVKVRKTRWDAKAWARSKIRKALLGDTPVELSGYLPAAPTAPAPPVTPQAPAQTVPQEGGN